MSFLNEYYEALRKSNATEKAAFERADRARFKNVARWLSQHHTISFAKALYTRDTRVTTSESPQEDYAAELLLFKQILTLAVDEVRQRFNLLNKPLR